MQQKLTSFILPVGGDLCQVHPALHGSVPAPGGTELPGHFHSQRNGPGRKVSFSAASSGFRSYSTNKQITLFKERWSSSIKAHLSRLVFADCLATSNLRILEGGSWSPLICLAEEWTLSESTSSSTTTCQKTQTPICTG